MTQPATTTGRRPLPSHVINRAPHHLRQWAHPRRACKCVLVDGQIGRKRSDGSLAQPFSARVGSPPRSSSSIEACCSNRAAFVASASGPDPDPRRKNGKPAATRSTEAARQHGLPAHSPRLNSQIGRQRVDPVIQPQTLRLQHHPTNHRRSRSAPPAHGPQKANSAVPPNRTRFPSPRAPRKASAPAAGQPEPAPEVQPRAFCQHAHKRPQILRRRTQRSSKDFNAVSRLWPLVAHTASLAPTTARQARRAPVLCSRLALDSFSAGGNTGPRPRKVTRDVLGGPEATPSPA